MSWFDKPFNFKIDPDGRQDKSSGECISRPMDKEDWEKYGPKNNKKNNGFMLRKSDIQRSLEHRQAKREEDINGH